MIVIFYKTYAKLPSFPSNYNQKLREAEKIGDEVIYGKNEMRREILIVLFIHSMPQFLRFTKIIAPSISNYV